MSKTVKQIADELGVSKQAVHQKRKSKELSTALQPFTSTVDGSFTPSFTLPEDSEVIFLRGQVKKLQAELEKERGHNREKDKQLLDTLSKLAESQAALSAGQAADKQKALAEKIIEGRQQLSDEEKGGENSEDIAPSGMRKIIGKFFRKS